MAVAEVPIIFTERVQGQSKITRKIIWEALPMVWRLLFQNGLRRWPRVRPTSPPPPPGETAKKQTAG